MKRFLVMALLLCFAFVGMAGAAWDTSSDDDSTESGNEEDSEEVEFPEADDKNIFSISETEKFGAKLFTGLGDVPEGKPIKVLTTNGVITDGELDEAGWSQVINSFVSDDNQFETEADRQQYLQENEDFAAGVPNALPIHQKQLKRLLEHAAEEVDLSSEARIVVPMGTIFWENEGTVYNIPVFGAISYRSSQTGKVYYPDLEGEGFKTDLVEEYPYQIDTTSDVIGWYSQEAPE